MLNEVPNLMNETWPRCINGVTGTGAVVWSQSESVKGICTSPQFMREPVIVVKHDDSHQAPCK